MGDYHNNIQKWIIVGAVCLIAISLFLITLQRYAPISVLDMPATFDKWTGKWSVGKQIK